MVIRDLPRRVGQTVTHHQNRSRYGPSPGNFLGLYPPRPRQRARSLPDPRNVGKKRAPLLPSQEKTGLITGDDLLSQDLSSHYHRRLRVSLPGSEWDRVVPLCYGHQKLRFGDRSGHQLLLVLAYHKIGWDRSQRSFRDSGLRARNPNRSTRTIPFFLTTVFFERLRHSLTSR